MIGEAIDTVFTLGWALAVWIVIAAAVTTPVVLLTGWVLGRAVKRAWRALRGPSGAPDAPDAAPDPQDAPEALSAHTETPGHQEAA